MTIEQASQQITKFWASKNNFNGTFTISEILFFLRRKDYDYIKKLGYNNYFNSIENFKEAFKYVYSQIGLDVGKIKFFVGENNNDNFVYLVFTETLSESEEEIIKNTLHISLNQKDTNMYQLVVE